MKFKAERVKCSWVAGGEMKAAVLHEDCLDEGKGDAVVTGGDSVFERIFGRSIFS